MRAQDEVEGSSRGSRRAVRQAGTVGGDDADLISVLPAMVADQSADEQSRMPAPGSADERSPRPAPDSATEPAARHRPSAARAVQLERSDDDTDVGWGEREPGSNDDRLTSDKPPHW